MDQLKNWWQEASSRDQMAVLALALVLAVYVLFSYVLFPVQAMADKEIARVTSQQAVYERVKILAAQWQGRQTSGDVEDANVGVEQAVQSSFSKHDLRPSGFDASGRSGIRVRFDSAEYVKLLAWMHDLETQQNLRMKDINIAASSDIGRVSASILIQKN